jgi:amidohydrolase
MAPGALPALSPDVEALRADTVELRRRVHRRPELAFQEVETARLVTETLERAGLEVSTGVARTGVVGLLRGSAPGRTLALRADMDALPLEEETGAAYSSEIAGRMHACGHDAHVAMAVSTARVLAGRRERLKGAVKFIFQPAEEGPGGAELMVREGVLKQPDVDGVMGLHVWNDLEVGLLGIGPGPILASTDDFRLLVKGVGGHGAYPHEAVDPVLAAAHIVVALQAIVSRNLSPVEPGVVSVGTIRAGTALNVIPRTAELGGTLRAFSAEARELLGRRLLEVAQGVAAAHGAEVELQLERGYPAAVNHTQMTELCAEVATGLLGGDGVVTPERSMGGEDMSYFLQEVPGCFVCLGSMNKAKGLDAPHHSPRFDIDEDALPLGVEFSVRVAEAFLSR